MRVQVDALSGGLGTGAEGDGGVRLGVVVDLVNL
jgi:hypothetical protein